jgi:hypothetical protein
MQSAINSSHLTEEGGHRNVFNAGTFQMHLICRYCSLPEDSGRDRGSLGEIERREFLH